MLRSVTLGVLTRRLALTTILAVAVPLPAGAQTIPGGWSSSDVGSVGASGASSGSGGDLTLLGGGADIWGTADGFHFVYRTMTGDGEVVTRVRRIDYIDPWSKAGVMMRESLEAGAKYSYMLASAGEGTAFQRRQDTNSSSISTSSGGAAGGYLRVTRSGNRFDAYESTDGESWSWVGSDWVDMPPTIYVGVAVTSHRYGVLTTAMFSDTDVTEWTATPPGSSLLPSDWSSADVGAVAASGWAAASGDEFHVGGSGIDIWNAEDSFHYAYRRLSGDGSITVRVSSLDWADAWTKGGVMMRESLSPGSSYAMMTATAGNGLAFQRRPSHGADSVHTAGAIAYAPSHLRLVRYGDTFIGYSSADGSNWTEVGREYIPMAADIYVGLAVTSHANGAIATAAFSGVQVTEGAQPLEEKTDEGSAPPARGSATLRMMHWNVHHGGIGTDGYYDPDRVAAWIAAVNPEVATLNEVDNEEQLYNIVSALNARTGISWSVAFAAKNAVLTRLSAHHTSVCGYGYTYQSAPQATIVVNGQLLNIWAVHLDADADYARLYEIAVLRSCLDGQAAHIVGGDFNMQANSPEYWAMAPGYIDAWDTARSLGTTLNYANNCDGCTRNTRIDYFFSSNLWLLAVESAQIIDTRDGFGYMPSDHKPLVVTYRVQ